MQLPIISWKEQIIIIHVMKIFAMPEIRTINGMPNVPSYSTIVALKALDIIPVTNFCSAVKLINNTESKLWVSNHYQGLVT
jgi:hypothetical protein